MTLNETQARETLTSPNERSNIDSVRNYESSLRVFTEELDHYELKKEIYWRLLNERIKHRIEKKYERTTQFMRYPLPIVQITDSILNDYFKVFEGKNRFFNVESDRNIEGLKRWIAEAKPEQWIENEARMVLKNRPCSIVVIDRKEDGTPYLINVDSTRLVDAQLADEDGQCEYVSFVHSRERDPEDSKAIITYFSVYDDERYRVYSKRSKGDVYVLEIDKPHNIGYCPARMFVKTASNTKNPFKRRVAFGQSISKLEDWTIFDVFRNYMDHYAPFPVTEAPKSKCANVDCKDGKVSEEEIIDHATGQTRTKWSTCQVCEGKGKGTMIGPGTHIGIKLQGDKSLEDGSGKFKMHFPETDKMDYIPKKLDELELEIRYKTVGVSNLITNEAINEIQAKGSFASMDNVLMRTKEELDFLYKWIVDTVGSILYKNARFQTEANFGTEWYLITEEELQERFKAAKAIGLPKSEQVAIYEQIIETKYRGNSTKVMRQKMLLRLDPFPLYTEAEVINLYDKQAITFDEMTLKINFYSFVSRFEDENTVITEFGLNLEMRDRIKIISETLKQYNDENNEGKQLQPSTEGAQED